MQNTYKGWTVELKARTPDGHAFIIDVEASKKGKTLPRQFRDIVSQEGLKQAVIGWIDTLETPKPEPGVIDFTPPTTPEPLPPTQADLDKQKWQEDWKQLQAANKLAENGVNILSAAQLTALQNKVRTGFKADYVDVV